MPQFSAFNVSCRFFSGDERRCVLRFDAMRRVVQVVVDEKPCPETFYAGKLLCAFPSVGYACALFAHFRDGSAPFHIHCATERERDLLVQALNGARDGDYSALDGLENGMILCDPVRLPGRLTSTSREAVLVSSRLLLYRNSVATLPLLVLSLEEAELDTPKPDTLSVRQGGMRVAVRFSDTATADKWLAAITKVVKEVRSAHVAAKAERRRQAVEARRSSAHRASAAAADAVGVDVGGERSGAATATSSDARPATGPASGGGGGGGGRGVSFADIVRQAQNRGTLLTAWGGNESGQLGGGARSQQCASSPTVVRALRNSNAPDAIAAGARHCMAVTKQGAAFAWGAGTDGQLGLGSNCRQSTRPFLISSFRGITVRHVACGRAHSLALADGGAVWGWGSNAAGQLGTGATSGSLWIPRRLNATSDAGFPDVRALAAGGDASAALAVDGAVFAWGAGRYGQVGSGSSENALSPKRVRGCGDKQFAQVVLGATFALAVSIDGRVWQWGRMGRAEKPQEGGQGEEEDEEDEDEDDASAWASPIEVAGLDGPIRAVSAGTAHAVALGGADSSVAAAPLSASEWFDRAKSVMASPVETEVYQWGPSAAPPTPPTAERVEALCGKQVVAVAAGDGFSVAVTRSGGLFAWGKLGSGQAGNGSFDTVPLPPDTPTIVEPEPGMQLSPLLACCGQAVMAIAIKTSALQQPAGNALATKLAAKWRERAAAGRSRGDGDNDNHQGEAVEAPLSRAAPSDTSPPPPPPPPPPAVTASAGAASASAGRISSDFDLPPPPPPPPPPSSGAKAKADRSTAAEGSEAEHDGEPMPPTSSQPPLKGAVPQAAASGAARTERGSDGSEPPPPPPPELESPPYMG